MSDPIDISTADEFGQWLTAQIDEWCRDNGLPPGGEGTDMGDMYRELDSADAFSGIGVTLIPAYDEQVLYVVGRDASWIASTGIELGIESETILFDPLNNLQLDVPVSELSDYRDRTQHVADQITSLLEHREHGQGGRP